MVRATSAWPARWLTTFGLTPAISDAALPLVPELPSA